MPAMAYNMAIISVCGFTFNRIIAGKTRNETTSTNESICIPNAFWVSFRSQRLAICPSNKSQIPATIKHSITMSIFVLTLGLSNNRCEMPRKELANPIYVRITDELKHPIKNFFIFFFAPPKHTR